MKKILAVLLSVMLVMSSLAVLAFAAQYNDIPCVIVPGIGQSRAWLVDDNGEYVLNDSGEKIHCFPGNFDVKKILSDVAVPLASSVATQSDAGLSDALADSIENAFYMNKTKDNGEPCGYVKVETYPHSLAECTEEQRQYIFDCIPMQRMGETIGFENMYYYAYNSFGNAIDMADGLYDFIQLVKQQTGKDKVNIIPISMGGAIFNGLMELHPEVADDLHRVVFVVPALNGSLIVSDIYEKELAFLDADYLYSDFFDGILGEANASLIEVAIRVLPKDVLMTCLDKTVDRLLENVFANCTGIWMLVPNDQYGKCVKKNLSDKSKAEIRRQTDIYHRAQSNSNKNILSLMSKGVEVFDVLGYDVPLYNVGNSWNSQNADGVIHTYSTSIGAKMANVGETLPDGYVQANTYCKTGKAVSFFDKIFAPAASNVVQCSNPKHNHISPDNVVDASTGLLPDYTFYFDNQAHATANQNDIIMRLCCELVETDRIKDVYTDENFPQFNVGRATKELREVLLPAAENVDKSSLSDADRQELEQAVADAEAMLSRTIAEEGEAPAVEQRLRSILEKVGAVEPNESALDSVSPVVKTISDTLLSVGGAKGYSDMPKDLISNLTNSNSDDNPTDNNGGSDTNSPANNTPAVTPTGTSANTIPSGTAANNPKTTGGVTHGLYATVAAFAAFSVLATVKVKRKKEE
ncbi:MAG: hypothetical protein J5877_06520 [Clostridia bacterium]|nr:hypothetical protein [Clostridia bacterium]